MKYNHMQRGFKEGKERKERNAHFISFFMVSNPVTRLPIKS
jgi:hypothetical protein